MEARKLAHVCARWCLLATLLPGLGSGAEKEDGRVLACPPLPAESLVDGLIDEWQSRTPLVMANDQARLWLGWAESGLGVAAQVSVAGDAAPSALSLFFDGRPPGQRRGWYSRGAYHLKLFVAPSPLDPDWIREQAKTGYWLADTDDDTARRVIWKEFSWTGARRAGVRGAARVEGRSVSLEAFFPWEALPLPSPVRPHAGMPVAVDWAVGGLGRRQLFWHGDRETLSNPLRMAAGVLVDSTSDRPPATLPSPDISNTQSSPTPLPSERESGFSVTETPSPVQFEPGERVAVEVFADQPIGRPASPQLYGQFSEPLALGQPIAPGISAQLVLNPGFESGHPSLTYAPARERLLPGRAVELLNRWAPSWKQAGAGRRVPPPWALLGEQDVVSWEQGGAQPPRCLRLHGNHAEAGVGQVVRLPLHRTREYHAKVFARSSEPCALKFSLRTPTGAVAEARAEVAPGEWRAVSGTLHVPAELPARVHRFLYAIAVDGAGDVAIDYATLLPADAVDGLCPEVIELFRELKPGSIRYPGGNFASGYHWRDGIGPRQLRPTRLNVAWLGLESNEIGTDEMLRFCRLAGVAPLLCVNAGDGTAREAADWVEYCNGATDTPMGKLRAENGHPEPYRVRDWDIGNEVWGHWQIGHCAPDEYARRVVKFSRAMRRRDDGLRLFACGHSPFTPIGRLWNRLVCEQAAGAFDVLTFHTYVDSPPPVISDRQHRTEVILSNPHVFEQTIRDMVTRMQRWGIERPQVAVTEYNLRWRQFQAPPLDHRVHLLWYAQMLHVWLRCSDVLTACHVTEFSIFDIYQRFLAGGPSTRTAVFRLYANRAGNQPVRARVTGPTYRIARKLGRFTPVRDVPFLDAVALTGESQGRRQLTVGLVNKRLDHGVTVRLRLHGFRPQASADLHTLTIDDGGRVREASERVHAGEDCAIDLPAACVALLIVGQTSPGDATR